MSDQTPDLTEVCHSVVEALIIGLETSNPKLNEKCSLALTCFGHDLIPHLRDLASDPQTKPAYRKRLLRTVERIFQEIPPDARVSRLLLAALMHGLRSTNERVFSHSSRAIVMMRCEGLADQLILEALRQRHNVRYCRRLLHVAGEVGGPVELQIWLDVMLLTHHKNVGIQVSAALLIEALRPFQQQVRA